MSKDEQEIVMARYETYCRAFITLAIQINHIESTTGLDLTPAKNTMYLLLEQMILQKPTWIA